MDLILKIKICGLIQELIQLSVMGAYILSIETASLVTAGLAMAGVTLPGIIVVGGVIILSIGFEHLIRTISGYWD